MEQSVSFEKSKFSERLSSMLKVDFRRAFKSKTLYILSATALLMPILMTVMMTMMDGSVSVDPQTGVETVMKGPENSWQNIGTLPGAEQMGGSEIFAMCNVNMMFMAVAVFIGLFIASDFRSGFAKNLFTTRTGRGEYVFSKTLVGFLCGSLLLILYFVGAMLGGAATGLSFDLCGLTPLNIVWCLLSKIFLMLVFVAIDVLVSVCAKKMAWLSICGSLGGGMLLFTMVSLITPLSATLLHVSLCLGGGLLFALGLGAIGRVVLRRTSLV